MPALPSMNASLGQFLKLGFTYPQALQMANGAIEYGKNALGLNNEQLAAEQHVNELVGSRVANIEALDPSQRAAAWQQAAPELARLDPSVPWASVDPTDTNQLERLKANTLAHKTVLDWAETQQKTSTAAAQEGEAKAGTAQKQAEANKVAFENTLLKGAIDPARAAAAAEQIAPAAQYPDIHRQLVADTQNATSAAALQAARDKASTAVLGRTPEAMQAKGQEAATVAKATAPIEEQKAELLAKANHARSVGDTVNAKYYDSLADQQQSVSTANTIQKVLDLSKQGNAIAGSQLKAMVPEFTNAIQDIKRMAASQGDKGLGSAQEHLSSELASIAEGKPLSDKVQAEIAPYVQTIANGATARHNAQVQALKQAYPEQAKGLKAEASPFGPAYKSAY